MIKNDSVYYLNRLIKNPPVQFNFHYKLLMEFHLQILQDLC